MAARHWVGGTASWNGTAGSKWSLTEGGAGGQAEPSSLDAVFFDAGSGAVTVTVSGSVACASLTCTGFTGTITGASPIVVAGNAVLSTGGTYTGLTITLNSDCNLTTNGKTITALNQNSIGCTLQDALTCSGTLTHDAGAFNANNKSVTVANYVSNSGSNVRTLSMGSGTWTLTGTGLVWDMSGGSLITVTASTSTVKLTNASASSKTFNGNDVTYHGLWLTGAGTGAFIITGSNVFSSLTIDTPPHTVQFESGSTQTVTTISFSGSSSGLMTLEPVGSAHWNLTSAAGVSASYLSLRGSHVHGGAFTAANSFDAGDNFNWDFVRSSSTDVYFDSAYQYSGSATATLTGLNWLIGETLGVVADGVDIGDATVSSAGNLTLPSSATGSVITVGKRYLSRAVTLRAPQTGNQDGASLGRQMNIKKAAADILDTPYLKVGTLTGTEIIPPGWRGGVTGDGTTGLYEVPIDDSHMNEGVIVFETDKGYTAVVRAVKFSIESEP